MNKVIAISREFGSGGRTIGKKRRRNLESSAMIMRLSLR